MADRAVGLGLRAQIALILGALFSLSAAPLFALTLSQERQSALRVVDARAETLALLAEAGAPLETLSAAVDMLVARGALTGAHVAAGARQLTRGEPRGSERAVSSPHGQARVTVWSDATRRELPRPWLGVLIAYVVGIGLGVALFAELALTRLISRPVAALTRAAQDLADGAREARVPIAGAREVAQLGVSFNRMARALGDEQRALADKVAELTRTSEDLMRTRDQLVRSEKLASVGRLAAGLAHEIGNPLAAILGLVELLRGGGLGAGEQAEFLARIHAETERIHRILRDLLDFARRRPSEPGPQKRADLAQVVSDAVRLVRAQADARGVRIDAQLAEAAYVTGSADELAQVVMNLLLNALDAVAGAGAITLRVVAGEAVTLSVEDTGPGIAEQVRSTLFEPFVTTKPEGKGTGLGLAVCQGIVGRLGGSIEGQNSAEGGACFRVTLPRGAEA
jgi:two-component system, NtrC family, sensor kinase